MDLVERVAARHRLAAFIPDKFFKAYESELKKILAKPLDGYPMRSVGYETYASVVPLLKKCIDELTELAPQARATLEGRLELRKSILERIVASYDKLRKDVRLEWQDKQASPRDHLLFHIALKLDDLVSKAIPTLGKAYKVTFSVDTSKVDALVTRTLKKATPLQIDAVTEKNTSPSAAAAKMELFGDLDRAISRLLKKEKVDVPDLTKWFEGIRDVLAANYTDEADVRDRKFSLNGMTVVINDATVTPKEHDAYVKYLDEAYHRLKAKKLARAWYGVIYIECHACGGVNPNSAQGTGAQYITSGDYVDLYNRPYPGIVKLVVHELGHRYWYKSLNERQRDKFERLVRVHSKPRPDYVVQTVDPKSVARNLEEITDYTERARRCLGDIAGAVDDSDMVPTDVLEQFRFRIAKVVDHLEIIEVALNMIVKPFDAQTETLMKRALEANYEVMSAFRDWRTTAWTVTDPEVFRREIREYVTNGQRLVTEDLAAARAYAEIAPGRYNEAQIEKIEKLKKERQDEWDADPRQVLPVSDYGESNTSEAFAEAFAYYVMDKGMNADQEASFKAVLLDKDRTAARVAARWFRRAAPLRARVACRSGRTDRRTPAA